MNKFKLFILIILINFSTLSAQQHHFTKNYQGKGQQTAHVAQNFQKNKNTIQQISISQNTLQHIKDRHWYNANQGPNTSHFNHSMTDKKLHKLALATINQGSERPSKYGQGKITYQHRFNKPIGKTSTHQNAYSLRLVTDANKNVITAFPVR